MIVEYEQLIVQKQFSLAAELAMLNPKVLQHLMNAFFTCDYRTIQPLIHVLDYIQQKQEPLLYPYFSRWISLLQTPHHNGFHRNSYRFFQYATIPKDYEGTLYTLAFSDMMNVNHAVAIKVFAMTTCYNIAKNYPALLNELKEAIDFNLLHAEKPGLIARSKHLLKKIALQTHS